MNAQATEQTTERRTMPQLAAGVLTTVATGTTVGIVGAFMIFGMKHGFREASDVRQNRKGPDAEKQQKSSVRY